MAVEKPGTRLTPSSSGKGISPWGWITILAPAAWLISGTYSFDSMLRFNLSPESKKDFWRSTPSYQHCSSNQKVRHSGSINFCEKRKLFDRSQFCRFHRRDSKLSLGLFWCYGFLQCGGTPAVCTLSQLRGGWLILRFEY